MQIPIKHHISPKSISAKMQTQTDRRSFGLLSAVTVFLFFCLSQLAHAADRPVSFADLAEAKSPAVVNISTTTIERTGPSMEMPQFPPGSPFEEFFKEFQDRGQTRRAQSLGSGFIIDKTGYVVTNNHVIEGADEITVSLANNDSFPAKLVGRDPKTDIALLKIDPEDTVLSAVSFGDSNALRVGDWVMAIGNPFGLGGTVTAGIVSARGRDIGSGPYDDFIQTDASINRGNSGGPLFNMDGEVIGINTAIFSQTGGSVGIGFAISSNLAVNVVQQLRDFGRTKRGWLGVFIQEITPDIAESLGLDEAAGALISAVSENGPADEAGIEPGDVVLSFDGKTIERMRDLPRIVAETPVEKSVAVELFRNGKTIEIQVVLGELEQAEQGGLINGDGGSKAEESDVTSFGALGFSAQELTAELVESFDLPEGTSGIVITEVIDGSPAASQGLEAGGLIRRVGQRAVRSLDDLSAGITAAEEAGKSGVLLLVEQQGRTRFVQLPFAGKE
ncbi:MAG: DegQ family serine endoprotease [Candidatus Puniceispirillaceae bacterium]